MLATFPFKRAKNLNRTYAAGRKVYPLKKCPKFSNTQFWTFFSLGHHGRRGWVSQPTLLGKSQRARRPRPYDVRGVFFTRRSPLTKYLHTCDQSHLVFQKIISGCPNLFGKSALPRINAGIPQGKSFTWVNLSLKTK